MRGGNYLQNKIIILVINNRLAGDWHLSAHIPGANYLFNKVTILIINNTLAHMSMVSIGKLTTHMLQENYLLKK
jgi:hypothetical protein